MQKIMKVLQKENLMAWLSDEVEIWASCSSKIYGQILLRYLWTGSTVEGKTFWGGPVVVENELQSPGPVIWFNIEIKGFVSFTCQFQSIFVFLNSEIDAFTIRPDEWAHDRTNVNWLYQDQNLAREIAPWHSWFLRPCWVEQHYVSQAQDIYFLKYKSFCLARYFTNTSWILLLMFLFRYDEHDSKIVLFLFFRIKNDKCTYERIDKSRVIFSTKNGQIEVLILSL